MSKKLSANAGPLTDYDLFMLRNFCAEELKKYLRPMREFWNHVSSYTEMPPGDYPTFDSEFVREAGFHIEKRHVKTGPLRNIAAYPFVRASKLKVLPASNGSRHVFSRIFDDPIRVEEFYCLMKGGSQIAYLTEKAYAATLANKVVETSVVLGREEAYAILSDKTLSRTKNKLKRLFGMEEGEWETELLF